LHIAPVTRKISLSRALTIGKLLEGIYGILRVKKEPKMTRFLAEQLAMSHWFSIARAEADIGYKPSISTEAGVERLVTAFRK
jgi:nucleoside-diphosphate-sugar epimerase